MKRILIVAVIAAALFAYLEYTPKTELKVESKFAINDISLFKDGNLWKFESSPEIPVNQSTASSVISTLESIGLEEPLEGMPLPEPVSLRAKIDDKDLTFGKENEYLSKTYLKYNEKIYLVPNYISKSLDKKLDDFREKKLIKAFPGDLKKITLKKSTETISLANVDSWRLTEPVSARASQAVIREILSEIRDLSADELIFGEEIKDPDLEIELVKQDDSKLVIKLKKVDPKESKSGDEPIYFSVSDYKFLAKTKPNPTARIFKAVNELREKKLFVFSPSQVKKLQISGTHSVLIEKTENGFTVDGKEGDTTFINEYLNTLASLEAVDFPSSSLPAEELKFSLVLNDGSEKVLEIGRYHDKGRIAKTDELFIISEDYYKKIVPKLEQLLPAK